MMKFDDALTIGDLLKREDEKSLIFAEIHAHIIKLCCANNSSKEESIKAFLELLTIEHINAVALGEEELNPPSDLLPSHIDYFVAYTYNRAFIFLKNDEEERQNKNALLNILIRPSLIKTDLQLLSEVYSSFKNIEWCSSNAFAKRLHELFTPKEIDAYISKQNSKAGLIRQENKRIREKPLVDEITRLWDVECAKNPTNKPKQTHIAPTVHAAINKNEPLKLLYKESTKKDEIDYEKVKSVIAAHEKIKKQSKK